MDIHVSEIHISIIQKGKDKNIPSVAPESSSRKLIVFPEVRKIMSGVMIHKISRDHGIIECLHTADIAFYTLALPGEPFSQ